MYVWKVIGKPGLLVVIIHMIYLQSCHFYGTKRYVISLYSANCSNQFLWQMFLNPVGLGATFLATLKLYRVMSDGKSGQGKGGNGTDQNNPWDFFSLYIIPFIFQIISNEEMYWKGYQSSRIMVSGKNLGAHPVQVFFRAPIFVLFKLESLFSKTLSSLSLSFLYWRDRKYRQ